MKTITFTDEEFETVLEALDMFATVDEDADKLLAALWQEILNEKEEND